MLVRIVGRAWVLLGLLAGAPGCFEDVATSIDRVCPAGQQTCACTSEGACDNGLTCDDGQICRSRRCQDGTPGCACLPGDACEAGALCRDGSCFSDAPMPTAGESDVTSDTSSSKTTEGSMGEVGDVGEVGEVDGMITSGMIPGTGVESGLDDTGSAVGDDGAVLPPAECGCGWADPYNYWECTPEPSDVSPTGVTWGCPPWVAAAYDTYVAGGQMAAPACTAVNSAGESSTIDDIGCCLGWEITVFCSGNAELVFNACDDTDFLCAPTKPKPSPA